jgi:hypothetical protein
MRKYLVILVSFISIGQAYSVTKTSTSANWSTPGHWSPTGVPANGDVVFINSNMSIPSGFVTNSVQSVTINSGRALTINGTGGLFFVSTLTVSGSLNLSSAATVGGAIFGTGDIIVNASGNLNMNGTSNITVANVSNAGSFNANSTGSLTLFGNPVFKPFSVLLILML